MFDNSFIEKKIEVSKKLNNKSRKKTIWNTEKVEKCTVDYNNGEIYLDNPFVEGKTNKRKPLLPFVYSKEEMEELAKCYQDVVYFAENYCKVTTDDGVMHVKMRDYQDNMLHNFQKNRFNILLASRQIGKCVDYETEITLRHKKSGNIIRGKRIGDFFHDIKAREKGIGYLERFKLWLISKLENIKKNENETETYKII